MKNRATGRAMSWLLAACLGAAPAAAQVHDYDIVFESSSEDSIAAKVTAAECPAGTALLGGGAGVFGGTIERESLITSHPLIESGSGDVLGWQAVAQEVVSDPEGWQLRVYAICGNVPGLEMVTATTALNSTGIKATEALCPIGKTAISGGVALDGSTDDLTIFKSAPMLEETSRESIGWEGGGVETSASDGLWSAKVYAICADLDVIVVQANTGSSNDVSRTVQLFCPARTVALGGGADISGVVDDWIEAMYPSSIGSIWTGRSQRPSDQFSTSTFQASVICPEPGRALPTIAVLAVLLEVRRRRARARRSCI